MSEFRCVGFAPCRRAAESDGMNQASRSLLVLVVASALLVAAWLLVLQPGPEPSQTPAQTPSQSYRGPLAPLNAVEQARGAGAVSDAANARLQAQGEAQGTAP